MKSEQTTRSGPIWPSRIAFLVSALTSPFVVTAATAALAVWFLQPSIEELLLWVGIAAGFTAVIPFLIVFAMWRAGRVTDIHVALREQRTVPFIATIISAAVGLWLLHVVGAPDRLLGLAAAFVINGALLAIITLRWKISLHAATFAACVIALSLIASPSFLLGLALLPVVFWARMYRKRHTLLQGLAPALIVSILTPVVYLSVLALLGPE